MCIYNVCIASITCTLQGGRRQPQLLDRPAGSQVGGLWCLCLGLGLGIITIITIVITIIIINIVTTIITIITIVITIINIVMTIIIIIQSISWTNQTTKQ